MFMREVSICAKNAVSIAMLRSCCNLVALLVAEYIADPSATVSVVITFRMVTDVESASGDACVDVTSGSLSAYGFRIRREFNCVTVWGIGCRLLRCPLSRGKTGGYRGKVGAGRVNSRVWFTHSRSVVTAATRGLLAPCVCVPERGVQGRRIVKIRSNLGRMVLLAKVCLVR